MDMKQEDFQVMCQNHLDRYFAIQANTDLQRRSLRALRLLSAFDEPLTGKPEGWAAGIIYAAANRYKRACGVPGFLNSEFEHMFGASMSTIRKRAAQVERMLEF